MNAIMYCRAVPGYDDIGDDSREGNRVGHRDTAPRYDDSLDACQVGRFDDFEGDEVDVRE